MTGRRTQPTAPAGYSKRPLPDELGYKPGQHALFVGLPPELSGLASAVPFAAVTEKARWDARLPQRRFDLVHAFTKRKADLDTRLSALQKALQPDAAIWVAWPKKASKIVTDVTVDRVREAALRLDLVDVKVGGTMRAILIALFAATLFAANAAQASDRDSIITSCETRLKSPERTCTCIADKAIREFNERELAFFVSMVTRGAGIAMSAPPAGMTQAEMIHVASRMQVMPSECVNG